MRFARLLPGALLAAALLPAAAPAQPRCFGAAARDPLRACANRTLRLTVGPGPCPAAGSVTLDVPPGLRADPAGPLGYQLSAREFTAWDITVTADSDTALTRHFLAARITDLERAVDERARSRGRGITIRPTHLGVADRVAWLHPAHAASISC